MKLHKQCEPVQSIFIFLAFYFIWPPTATVFCIFINKRSGILYIWECLPIHLINQRWGFIKLIAVWLSILYSSISSPASKNVRFFSVSISFADGDLLIKSYLNTATQYFFEEMIFLFPNHWQVNTGGSSKCHIFSYDLQTVPQLNHQFIIQHTRTWISRVRPGILRVNLNDCHMSCTFPLGIK